MVDFQREYKLHASLADSRRGFVAASQIYQELPMRDRQDWRKDTIDAPEHAAERQARRDREAQRRSTGPTSLAAARDWARRWRAGALAAVVALAAGCIPFRLPSPVDPAMPPVACVATYVPLAPEFQLGMDGCGHFWLRAPEGCFILREDLGALVEIRCPVEGDTLAVVPAVPR